MSNITIYHQEAVMRQKKNAGMNGFFLSKQCDFFGDKPLIETMATNLMTSDPCQLKLTIEGADRFWT